MQVVDCTWDEFPAKLKNQKIFCFGAGAVSHIYLDLLKEKGLLRNIEAFVDNASSKIGTKKEYHEFFYPIVSTEFMVKNRKESVVLITCSDTYGVVQQLSQIPELSNMECYGMYIMLARQFGLSSFNDELKRGSEQRIPKKIHYCWIGGTKLPDKYKKCIDSWRKYCPDYEIIEWNESNYDFTKVKYMREAYEAKKWGFVPDYMRLDIIYKYGGIYLDTDVEILRNIDDLLYQDAFSGFDSQLHINIGSGFGAIKNHKLIGEMRDYYLDKSFISEDGNYDLTPCMVHQQNVLCHYGIRLNDRLQVIKGMTFYPMVVMNERDMNALLERKEKCTCFKHYGDGSWMGQQLAEGRKKRVNYIRKICGVEEID